MKKIPHPALSRQTGEGGRMPGEGQGRVSRAGFCSHYALSQSKQESYGHGNGKRHFECEESLTLRANPARNANCPPKPVVNTW